MSNISAPHIAAHVGPAPTTKPPTPPSVIRATGSLSKGSREYRTPPAVAPPQVGLKGSAVRKNDKLVMQVIILTFYYQSMKFYYSMYNFLQFLASS